jgi:regulator of Ty1 transposition protein 103
MSSKKEDEIHSANFLAQLKKLDCSQASIEQLSFWCQFHAKKASVLTPIWTESLRNSSNNQNVLAHVYLASDVIQNSRKKNKGEEWMKSWKSVMENSVKFVWEKCKNEAKIRASVKRMMDVWEERRVFGSRVKPKTWIASSDDDAEEEDMQKTNKRKNEMDTGVAASKKSTTSVSKKQKADTPPPPLRQSHDIKEMKANYLEGEDALLAEALHEMEKCERDLAEAEKVYEEDVSGDLLNLLDAGKANEPMENLYKTPTEQLTALQKCENAWAKKRAAVEKMFKANATLTKRLAILNKTCEEREKENKEREKWLSKSPTVAVQISTARMKASKRNAAYVATGGDDGKKNSEELDNREVFVIPEPVDMDKSDGEGEEGEEDPEEYEP